MRRARLVSIVGDYRRNKIREYRTVYNNLKKVEEATDSALAEIERAMQEKRERYNISVSLRKNREAKLRELRRRRDKYIQQIKQLEKSVEKLEQAISEGEKVEVEGRAFTQLRGKLPWPIKGERRILRGFGLKRDKKVLIENKGIDISVEPKTPVYAVCEGEVVYTSWLQGYENVVLLKHSGGYYTVYGNLGEVEVKAGDRIDHRQLLGYTSSTGWIDGPKLHFEVRKGREEENPMNWLTSR